MVELGRVAGDSMKCELYFRWSKPESGLMCPKKSVVLLLLHLQRNASPHEIHSPRVMSSDWSSSHREKLHEVASGDATLPAGSITARIRNIP